VIYSLLVYICDVFGFGTLPLIAWERILLMTRIHGKYFTATLTALNLEPNQEKDARTNAEKIVSQIVKSYDENIAVGHVGENAKGIPPGFTHSPHLHTLTGLVYGRIQSGKTRAMIASTAMAFDNGFKIVVVLTSNINDLVSQTHFDFVAGLPDVMVYTKDDQLEDDEAKSAKLFLGTGDARMLIVCSKGATSLDNVIKFLGKVDAQKYPVIIFDDEGDQASLDTNTRKRSQSNVSVAASSINRLIQEELRPLVACHVYVSVTGTPQAVLLQSAESRNRPSFIELLPPGDSYVGGAYFFNDDEPEQNKHSLIRIVSRDEKQKLLNASGPIPEGLRRAILFYLLSAAAAIANDGTPKHGKGYSFLCHPSLKNDEQDVAKKRISSFLNDVLAALLKSGAGEQQLMKEFSQEYYDLSKSLGEKTPLLPKLYEILIQYLKTRKILVINARAKRQGIAYGPGLNFLIGGNTLGRGIAIRDLLVTYYLRDSKVSQIDTMHQHARMFGYRLPRLAYTRLFVPKYLYYRFRDIHRSDQDLRQYIEEHKDNPSTFPVEFTYDLRTTRQGVLSVNTADTLNPGKQVYPNIVTVPQPPSVFSKVLLKLEGYFDRNAEELEEVGREGVIISGKAAMELVSFIKTKSDNTWRDRTIPAVVEKIAGKFKKQVMLKFRSASRAVDKEGFFSTGVLSGPEYDEAKAASLPTLWIVAVETKAESAVGFGKKFMYPTFVIPGKLEKLLMFSRS
jgi:hypothetical protein